MTQHTHKMVNGERVDLTPEEISDLNARDALYLADADIRKAAEVRAERNAKLAATDWTQADDVPQAVKDSYAPYRQALRDLPTQSGFPNQVIFPTQPE
jgi:hypothetical protein